MTRGFTLTELLTAIVLIIFVLLLMMPVAQQVTTTAERLGCAKNLKELYTAMNAYAVDHQNSFPRGYDKNRSPRTWAGVLQPYLPMSVEAYKEGVKRAGPTYCPSTRLNGEGNYRRDAATWRSDYTINGNIGARQRANLSGELIFFYDGNASGAKNAPKSIARHKGNFNCLFIDGSIEQISSFENYEKRWVAP